MAEVEGGEVEEVDDQNDLSNDEMSTNEQHDEGKLEKIVENEMTSNSRSSLDLLSGLREQMPQVGDLEQEEGEPGEC